MISILIPLADALRGLGELSLQLWSSVLVKELVAVAEIIKYFGSHIDHMEAQHKDQA